MNRLRRLIQVMLGALALALLFTTVASAKPAKAASGDLLFAFEGEVRKGPSKGTELAGELKLTPNSDGTVTGKLTLGGGSAIDVTGRLSNGNLSVAFDLGGTYVFGIGQADEDGVFKGPFVGPAAGDSGKWEASPITKANFNFSGAVTRGPSEGTTLAGVLALTIDIDNDFTGTLTLPDGTAIPAKGELNSSGSKIEVVFYLSDTLRIRGKGDATTGGGFAGPFRGPQPGDRGEWTATPAA